VKYLLDTNICIYLINAKPPHVLQQFRAHPVGEIGISSITVAELTYGVAKSRQRAQNQAALTQFLLSLSIVNFDERAATVYGSLRATLEQHGTPIGALDTLIAAQALSLEVILVTNNVREFARVEGLEIVNWAE
jgi:tRNA(fMet)-specific endonuclease VapC